MPQLNLSRREYNLVRYTAPNRDREPSWLRRFAADG